jgi:kinesin family protein 4/21/27
MNSIILKIIAGTDLMFTFDHVFGLDSNQSSIFDDCARNLLQSVFEGFNATIIAYGQTGSGKTYTMGSASSVRVTTDNEGIIPRVINLLFDMVLEKESNDSQSSYKISVQFLEIYGEEIRDLLDKTRTSRVVIRENVNNEVFVSGCREESVSSSIQALKSLEDGTKQRTTAATEMNSESSRSHGNHLPCICLSIVINQCLCIVV